MIFFELFYTFFYIGLFTFGGGYAMIPLITDVVTSKGWVSTSVLTDFIAISEATPGPFAINIATFIGSETGGILGSICSTIGVVLPSFIIILIVAAIITKFLNNKYVKGALNGVKPVVLALILSTAIIFLIKIIGFNGESILSSNYYFDRASLAILLMLFGLDYYYKRKHKKSLSPILLLVICAAIGLIVFGIFEY